MAMRRFFYLWLSHVAAVFVMLGFSWLLSLVTTVVERYSNPWNSNGVMILLVSALTAGFMMWAFRPAPNWFRTLINRLSEA